MKIAVVVLIGFLLVPIVKAGCLNNLHDVRKVAPCEERNVEVVAYLNVSRHGAWLSESAGALKNAVELNIEESASDPSIKILKHYMYRPQDYLNNTFRARFYGKTQCEASYKRVRAVMVYRVSEIEMSPIKDNGS